MRCLRMSIVSPVLYLSLALLFLGQHGCGTPGTGQEAAQPGRTRADAPKPKPAKASVVRVYEYEIDESVPIENRKIAVTIKDGEGNQLDQYTKKLGTRTRYEYSKYNPMQVAKAISETWVDTGDGREVLTKTETIFDPYQTPEEEHLYSPDGKTRIGTYSLNVTKGFRDVSWSSDVLYTKLPCSVYQYDGEGLKEVKDVPQTERGAELGKDAPTNVIFAEDFTRVKAVLPTAKLSEPIKKEDFEIDRVGFTLVTMDGKANLLPYVRGDLPDEDDKARWKTVVYSKVPKEFEEAFAQLSR